MSRNSTTRQQQPKTDKFGRDRKHRRTDNWNESRQDRLARKHDETERDFDCRGKKAAIEGNLRRDLAEQFSDDVVFLHPAANKATTLQVIFTTASDDYLVDRFTLVANPNTGKVQAYRLSGTINKHAIDTNVPLPNVEFIRRDRFATLIG